MLPFAEKNECQKISYSWHPSPSIWFVTLAERESQSDDVVEKIAKQTMATEEISGNIEMAATVTPSSHVQLAKQWLYQRKTQMKPWAEFFKSSRFSKPKTVAEAGRRVVKNLEDYQSNYILITILLFFYCV